MTKIKQMLCALFTICLLLIGSANAMAAQPDTPSISVSATATIEVAPDNRRYQLRCQRQGPYRCRSNKCICRQNG